MVKKLFPIFLILTLFLSFGCGDKKVTPPASVGAGSGGGSGGGSIPDDNIPDDGTIPDAIRLVYETQDENETITLHELVGITDCFVDWGDGSDPEECVESVFMTHEYTEYGEHTVQIYGGVSHLVPKGGNNYKLTKVLDIGKTGLISLAGSFSYNMDLVSFDVGKGDLSSVTSMNKMFNNANNLETVSFIGANTIALTDTSEMFLNSRSLNLLNLDGLNTSKVINMSEMFYGASGLTSLNLSGWNTSKVINMSGMFYGASGLTTIDFSGWDTSEVISMASMFYEASKITSLDLSSWNTSKVINMRRMFYGASGLTTIDFSGWDTSKVINMSGMFYGASGLTTLNLSGWALGVPAPDSTDMFSDITVVPTCNQLTFGDILGVTCQ